MSRYKEINFVKASGRSTSAKVQTIAGIALLVLIPLAILGLFASLAYNNIKQTYAIRREIQGYADYAASADVVDKQSKLDDIDGKNAEMQSYMANRVYAEMIMDSSNYMNPELMDTLIESRTPGTILSGISYNDGTIDYDMYATDYKDGPIYMDKLDAAGVYSTLTYVGFDSMSTINPDPAAEASSYYHYHVTIDLSTASTTEESVNQ